MAIGDLFGQGFALGIAGSSPNAAKASYDVGQDTISALMASLRTNADTLRANAQGHAADIRERHGLVAGAAGANQPIEIHVMNQLDGRELGEWVIETAYTPLQQSVSRRGAGRRRGVSR
jgi:hypothetical protein